MSFKYTFLFVDVCLEFGIWCEACICNCSFKAYHGDDHKCNSTSNRGGLSYTCSVFDKRPSAAEQLKKINSFISEA